MSDIKWTTARHGSTQLIAYYESPWSFEETVARLVTASGQPAASPDGGEKVSVEFTGAYRGQPFILYDYKGDRSIHIGGGHELTAPVRGLVNQLTEILSLVEPTPYQVAERYDEKKSHSWPPAEPGAVFNEATGKVLGQIMNVLGPESACQCSGCAYETNEAIRLLNTLGITYQPRRPKVRVEHDPTLERRGNGTS
jgi:hypothetical protein